MTGTEERWSWQVGCRGFSGGGASEAEARKVEQRRRKEQHSATVEASPPTWRDDAETVAWLRRLFAAWRGLR